jgi:hypothetical protein
MVGVIFENVIDNGAALLFALRPGFDVNDGYRKSLGSCALDRRPF